MRGWAIGAVAPVLLIAVLSIFLEAWSRAELISPPPTLIITDRHGRFLTEVGETDPRIVPFGDALGFWPMSPPPPKAVAATLAAEDGRFHRHLGVDVFAVARAALQNIRGGRRVSGASTIAMQVARMQDPGPRTYRKKAMEALTAILLVARHGRDEVLEHYLRIAPYGNRMRGYGYAARGYFDKPARDLSWAEVALLAALPQSPSRMDPYDWQGRARAVDRGRRVLDALLESGRIDADEHRVAHRQIGGLRMAPRKRRPDEAMHVVLRLSSKLADAELRADLAHRPIVESTIDLDVQRDVLSMLADAVLRLDEHGAGNGAVMVVDLEDNAIVAYVGSTDYFDPRGAGAIDYAVVPRSPGSTLKPLLYALGLDRRTITPSSILDDLPHTREPMANADRRFLGPMLPRMALGNSRNVPALRLQGAIGLDEVYSFMEQLGLHDGSLAPEHFGAGLSLGAMPVTLEALVRSYAALAREGRLSDPILTATSPRANGRRVLSEGSARQIGLFLSDPMARLPSFSRMGSLEYDFPVAVKTGTASGYRDAWTMAYSARYLVGVWIGHPDWRPMNRVTGASSAAPLARSVLVHLEESGTRDLFDGTFPPPEGSEPAVLCALTGKLATSQCDRTLVEWLPAGERPVSPCEAHLSLPVDMTTGMLALAGAPMGHVETRTFLDLGPRYAAWAAASGLPPPPSVALNTTIRRAGGAGAPDVMKGRAGLATQSPGSPRGRGLPWRRGRELPAEGEHQGNDGGGAGGDGSPPARGARQRSGSLPWRGRCDSYASMPQRPQRNESRGLTPAARQWRPLLTVTSPVAGRVLIRDPETPAEHATLPLEAVVDPAVSQVVWYVDGEPFEVVDHPYTTRWPIRPGEHTFQVRTLEGEAASRAVRVVVR